MYARSALLNKQLRELHDSCQTAVTGVCISNDWSQVVNLLKLRAVGCRCSNALFALFSVVEQLSLEEMTNLVRYSCLARSV